ncbi:MAG TPA: hypothetical protein VN661_00130 [Candidatus Acidoferrales bacterium]|nr:hypothetical protein [Candidatus Acidoferrales bacterium]
MNNTHARIALLAVLFLALSSTVRAQRTQSDSRAPQQFADLGDFKLQNGAVIQTLRLGYRTLGTLNQERSNAVLWPSWLGGRSADLLRYVGPGNVLDDSKYFVILVDAIGDGISTSPSNSAAQPRMKFPQFTIRDMVESEHKLLTTVLHISHLRAVMGISMGGMQTFEWVVAYPDFMDLGIPMAGSPQSTSYDKLLWTSQIDALEADPGWDGGDGTARMTRGYAIYNEIGSMNLTSPEYRVQHTSPADFGSFLASTTRGAGTAAAASDAIRQRQAIMSLDDPTEYRTTLAGLAARIRAKLLVFISPEDHTVNPDPAKALAAAANAPVVALDSPCGHISFDCISVGPVVSRFLADPASVKSQVLQGGER